MTINKPLNEKRFKRKYRPIKYNPIRRIDYSNRDNYSVIGTNNNKILGIFCYDFHYIK